MSKFDEIYELIAQANNGSDEAYLMLGGDDGFALVKEMAEAFVTARLQLGDAVAKSERLRVSLSACLDALSSGVQLLEPGDFDPYEEGS